MGAKELRNQLAHAADYARDEQRLIRFVQLLEIARGWIRELDTLSAPKSVQNKEGMQA